MKFTLRPYQETPVKLAIDFFRQENPEPSLIVLPTAWGKSILTAFVAANIPQYERLLVVQPSKELLEQNHAKYINLCGGLAQAGIYSASFGKKEIGRITYATIGSIKDIGQLFRKHGFTKMLIDEAHLYPRKEQSMLGKFLKDSGITQVLGITATPLKLEQFSEKQGDRFDKWSELIMLTNPSPTGTFFKKILHVGQISEMTSMGFWSPLRYEILPFERKGLEMNTTGSEFSENSLIRAYIQNNTRANIFGCLNWHKDRRHALVFVPTVEEAMELAKLYPNSAYVSGDMSKKDRKQVIDGFRSGDIRVIFNVGVLQTGFDYTKIDIIIFGMSTASVARYYQMVGRGVRIDPEKKDCLIVDMGGNCDRFGKVEDIFFKKGDRWRMYGTGGRLLSGVPVDTLGKISRLEINQAYTCNCLPTTISFGKHKGKHLENMPMSYLKWIVKERPPYASGRELLAILKCVENYVRDTTGEPPVMTMPDGQHAGESLLFIPTGYLKWYYGSREWNECNDSLKRGIENVLGYRNA